MLVNQGKIRTNLELLEKETLRLNEQGYDGDVEEKMLKAAKYYFGKKCKGGYLDRESDRERVKCNDNKRNYVCVSHELIIAMDEHIKNNVLNNNKKPADGYLHFEKINPLIIAAEINCLVKLDDTYSKDFISKKIKKTYKNRYYINNY